MKTLKECLATVKNPRRGQGKRYDLVHTLLYCVLAVARFEDRKAAQVLSALAVHEQVVLGLAGCVFTLDALHCQKTVEQVIASGSDLLCQVKSNQPKLYKAMRRQAKHHPAADHAYACDIGQRYRSLARSLPQPHRSAPQHRGLRHHGPALPR